MRGSWRGCMAVPSCPSGSRNIVYEERRQLNSAAKEAMARACARMIPDEACLFLNIGTSTEALARELVGHENLIVVTNNINVAQILGANPSCQITLTGGNFRPADGGLTGALAAQALRPFKFDFAVIGCSGVDADGELLDYDLQEVLVSQAALDRSRHSILLADQSKFGRAAPVCIASVARLDTVVTDAPVPATIEDLCRRSSTEVRSVLPG